MKIINEFDTHRDAQNIDLKQVGKFIQESGYQVIKLEQLWRHVTGELEKDGQKYFFKMASSKGIAPKTRNEYAWNKALNSLELELSLRPPKVYEQSEWGDGMFWFISDFIDGKPLAESKVGEDTTLLEDNLERVAQGAEDILNLSKDISLPNDKHGKSLEERKQGFLDITKHWMSQFSQDVSKLYEFIEDNATAYMPGSSHGDFTPWHIWLDKNNGLILIDGEHGKINGWKFYDVAYFYHRVFTSMERPDLADKFLAHYLEIHPMTAEEKLCFKVILAQRIIGGYFDAHNDKTSPKIHEQLQAEFLSDKII